MRNIILALAVLLLSMPVYAACSITGGACNVSVRSNWESPPLSERLAPNNLQEMQRPNAFQPTYKKPYYDELINTQSETNVPQSQYNSNCQFGVCLPGQSTGAGATVEE